MTDHRRPILKSQAEIETLAAAGAIAARALEAARRAARAGTTAIELDDAAETVIRESGATPTFLGFQPSRGVRPYPAATCISVNDAIVHGLPSNLRLESGDLVSIDCGVRLDDWNTDTAITITVGAPSAEDAQLIATCRDALALGVQAAVAGGTLGDIGSAIQARAETDGFRPFANLTGHGIGRSMWEPPLVPNAGRAGGGQRLDPGLVIAIEPMLTAGSPEGVADRDGWTIRTSVGFRAAHFEHTVAVTRDGPRILTTI